MRFKIIFIYFYFFVAFSSYAQTPCFDADVVRGCAPLMVNIIECTGGGQNLLYKYNEVDGFVPETFHLYTQPGIYTITQVGSFNGTGDSLRKPNYIEVLPTPAPLFEVKPCANKVVSIKITDNVYAKFIVDFGDGSPLVNLNPNDMYQHVYPAAQQYTITVTGNYLPENCGGSTNIKINSIDQLVKPYIKGLATLNKSTTTGGITLDFDALDYLKYEIYQKASDEGVFSLVKTIQDQQGGQIYQAINLNTADKFYCYKIIAYDACGNNIESEEICSNRINAIAENNQNNIQWSQANLGGAFQQYDLYKNGVLIQSFNNINTLNFIDIDVVCQQTYCYELITKYNLPPAMQVGSAEDCIKAISTDIPPTIQKGEATIEDGNVVLSWEKPNSDKIKEYIIQRSDNNNASQLVGTTTALSLTEDKLDIGKATYCYTLTYSDLCGNTSLAANFVCPVLLTVPLATLDKASLVWTGYKNIENSVQSYTVEKLDEQGNVYESIVMGLNFNYDDITQDLEHQIIRYRIKASTPDFESYSNVVERKQNFRLFFPNAFTPNDDGLNDTFEPKALFIKNFKMSIYNRLGQLIYATNDSLKGWDGRFRNQPADADVYVYTVEVEDFTGQTFATKGTFNLLK